MLILYILNIVVKSHSNSESRSNVIWNRWLKMSKFFSRWWHVVIIWANRMSRRTTFASSDLELKEDKYKCATSTFFFLGKSQKHLYCILVFAFKLFICILHVRIAWYNLHQGYRKLNSRELLSLIWNNCYTVN